MSYSSRELYTPCKKFTTCKNHGVLCQTCNQTHDRQGLIIFADKNIKNQYVEETKKNKR